MKCNLQWGITKIIMTICIDSGLHQFLIDSLEAMHGVRATRSLNLYLDSVQLSIAYKQPSKSLLCIVCFLVCQAYRLQSIC